MISKIFRLAINGHSALFKPLAVLSRPIHLQLELTTYCNLACPQCPRQAYLTAAPCHLGFDAFVRVLDKVRPFNLTLNGLGEPVMHPDLVKMIRFAKGRGIELNTTSNLLRLDEELMGALPPSGLDLLNISLDAADSATYRTIRGSSRFAEIIEKIRLLQRYKEELGLKHPLLRLCFVLQKENYRGMVEFYELASALGVEAVLFQVFTEFEGANVADGREVDIAVLRAHLQTIRKLQSRKRAPVSNAPYLLSKLEDLERYFDGQTQIYTAKCFMPWISLYISVEGDIRPCCRFSSTRFNLGNINDVEDVMEVFNSPGYRDFRDKLKQNRIPHATCVNCLADSIFDLVKYRFIRKLY